MPLQTRIVDRPNSAPTKITTTSLAFRAQPLSRHAPTKLNEYTTANVVLSCCARGRRCLIFTPAVAARHALFANQSQPEVPGVHLDLTTRTTYLQESRHRLIGAADLYLEEGSLSALAALGRALRLCLVRIVPGLGTSKDVVALLFGEGSARVEGLGDGEFVGTGSALEAVLAVVHDRDGQEVGAIGADWRQDTGWLLESNGYRHCPTNAMYIVAGVERAGGKIDRCCGGLMVFWIGETYKAAYLQPAVQPRPRDFRDFCALRYRFREKKQPAWMLRSVDNVLVKWCFSCEFMEICNWFPGSPIRPASLRKLVSRQAKLYRGAMTPPARHGPCRGVCRDASCSFIAIHSSAVTATS